MGETVFPRTSGFFSRNAHARTRAFSLLLRYLTPPIDRYFHLVEYMSPRDRTVDRGERERNFVAIFHSVEKYRAERNTRRGTRGGRRTEGRGGMRREKILTCIPRYTSGSTYVSFVFFYSHLLCPTNTREVFQGLAAWLFVPATQTQFAFRPLSFLHDTLLRVSSRFLLLFFSRKVKISIVSLKRNVIRLWMNIQSVLSCRHVFVESILINHESPSSCLPFKTLQK